jgi:predicted DCC family thiol-disulfide oxidoreductase YuxK
MERKRQRTGFEDVSTFDVHGVILFDGVCNLCNGFINFLIDHDPDEHFRFAPLQWDGARALLESCGTIDTDMRSIVLVDDSGCYSRSSAVLRIFSRLSGPWRYLRFLRFFPAWLRDPVYDLVARNRYRWFGRRDVCRVPTPELLGRFLASD